MTREEAKTVFLNRGYVEVDNGTYYSPNKWREACVVISEWLEQEPKVGHWIPKYKAEHPKEFICDQCGYFVNILNANLPFIDSPYEEYKFCSNCGCRMIEP